MAASMAFYTAVKCGHCNTEKHFPNGEFTYLRYLQAKRVDTIRNEHLREGKTGYFSSDTTYRDPATRWYGHTEWSLSVAGFSEDDNDCADAYKGGNILTLCVTVSLSEHLFHKLMWLKRGERTQNGTDMYHSS